MEYTTDWSGERNKEIGLVTLEELIELLDKEGHSLIIRRDSFTGDLEIEVYDGYRE